MNIAHVLQCLRDHVKNSRSKTNELDWIDKFVMHEQQNRGNSKEIIDRKLGQFYC